jgi:hypothetical protein
MTDEERGQRMVAWKERRDVLARALEIGPSIIFLAVLVGAAIYAAWNLAQIVF